MKSMFLCILLSASATVSFSQQTPQVSPPVQTDYLAKSKSQKTAAWVLLGCGAAAFAVAAPGNVSFDILPVLVIGGGVAALTSIPLFLASARNKRKARNATAFFKWNRSWLFKSIRLLQVPIQLFQLKLLFVKQLFDYSKSFT